VTAAPAFQIAFAAHPSGSSSRVPTIYRFIERLHSMALPPVLEEYFSNLRAGRLDEALDSFTPDTFYSHSAYDPGADGPTGVRQEAWGRDALRRMWELRQQRNWQHHIEASFVDDRFFLEGEVVDGATGEPVFSFLSSGRFSPDGLISSYVEYDTRPPVGKPHPKG